MTQLGYLPISVATLVPDTNVGLDLYRHEDDSGRYVLYLGSDYPVASSDLEKLRNRGIRRLYIPKHSQAVYQEYLRALAEDSSNQAPLPARVEALNAVILDVLATRFGEGDTDQTVAAVSKLGELAADIICRDEFAPSDLFRVLNHDYATFTHSANVAMYCAILGNELGLTRDVVEQITVGGLLHDLGKLEIEDRILSKPGKLEEAEFRIIQNHPLYGFRQLAHRTDLNEGQLMMVYQHHERLSGEGYPVGLVGDEIHPWAKICAVTDVFEALTSHRPYRTPMPRAMALELQIREQGTHFDPEILKCWVSTIKRDLRS